MGEPRQVLVTGAGGFIGSHLVERLVASGLSVRVFLRYTAARSIGNLRYVDEGTLKRVEWTWGNLEDPYGVAQAVRGCEIVFHLGALVGIPYSYKAPQQYVMTNVLGTLNVLEACRTNGVDRLVCVSSSEVYGSAVYTPIDEHHPLQGQSPYAASKIAAEKLAQSYALSFDLPVSIVRPFNTFGPRQSARAVIPTIIAQVLAKSEVRLGSLWPMRDFLFVADTVDGLLAVAGAHTRPGEVLNIGSGLGVSIGEVVRRVMDLLGVRLPLVGEEARVRPERSEVKELVCDLTKAQAVLGWRPAHAFEDGLRRTIEWVRAHPEAFRPSEYAVGGDTISSFCTPSAGCTTII
jgi:dTDP-glucose 4,6-dehydratase